MIKSPCRNCPKRQMDKNICALSCDLLDKLQVIEAGRIEPRAYSAVDAADEGRYQLMAPLASQSGLIGLGPI